MKYFLVVYAQKRSFESIGGYNDHSNTHYYTHLGSGWVKAKNKLEAYNIANEKPIVKDDGAYIIHIEELGDCPEEVKK